jgi:hypothetical protein
MRGAGSQLALEFGGSASPIENPRRVRRVRRAAVVRLVEHAPFPRARRDAGWRRGFTLDLSPQGLCLRAEEAVPVGSLLHVLVCAVGGRPSLDAIARVAWSAQDRPGAARVGLELVAVRSARERAPAPHLRLAAPRPT